MVYPSVDSMKSHLVKVATITGDTLTVTKPLAFRSEILDELTYTAVFGDAASQAFARWVIWEAAQQLGALPASIQPLYEAAGRGEYEHMTVPAMNLRGMAYDSARAAFRAALKTGAKAIIFEIARSEMGYCAQPPGEYATVVLAAAVREGYHGPVFIQGDHFQVNAKRYTKEPNAEIADLKKLIDAAIAAGFYNIDIDASTLVDLSKPTLEDQQELNVACTVELTQYIRSKEPVGVTISIGGEIGEVGHKNSTPEDLRAFMSGYLGRLPQGVRGISKVSVQTGTVHGGIPLADGTIAKVNLDLKVLEELSTIARKEYGMAGAVQHGASTLPEDAFDKFPQVGCAEVHLATGFQNIILSSKAFPADLRERMYRYLDEHHSDERKPGETDEQFYYKARKRVWGPFKADVWNLPSDVRAAIGHELEAQFELLFRKLGVAGRADLVEKYLKPLPIHRPFPADLAASVERGEGAKQTKDLAD
jgi:fructose/tagatose bisphosphate aldolase